MDNKIVAIHQPNFMPWLGYFYKIYLANEFIFLDDVQFIKTGSNYTNRVSLNIAGSSEYVTIPIKRGSGVQNIDKTVFLNEKWKKRVIGTLQANYAKTPYFKENREFIVELIKFKADNLAEYNINFIKEISKRLDFNTDFSRSSEFNIESTSTERLVELIKLVDGNIYLSGSGGDNYQDRELFAKNGIELIYNKNPKFEYPQPKSTQFISGVSIVDAIFNVGFETLKSEFFNIEMEH